MNLDTSGNLDVSGSVISKQLSIINGNYNFITSDASGTEESQTINHSYLDLNHNNYGYRIGGSRRTNHGGIFTLENNHNNNYNAKFKNIMIMIIMMQNCGG